MDKRLLSREGQIDLMREEGLLAKPGREKKKLEKTSKEKKEHEPQKLTFDKETGIAICEDCNKPITDARGCPNCIHNAYRDENPFEPNE
ncbi:MAG: hypothetical protein HOA57_00900 [Candidatus Magasanikbacteria bacterium]|jgi:hypothetical protein|nr:hypothetical protein [Candidatus Magasanikbacteria bacterium]MBT4314493.1 hypothetical protein [Candidatus Magasanikbacteria bacterium]MBT4547301.1 hypothetical protein [Candidatus Magasanikbacteria bacterium]MBT6818930.1 hypothetical protein [Candidatus Magasanikbacteria bacterium]